MTRYTPLLLSLAIAPLMGQSDCEPTETHEITVSFVGLDSGQPMANIPVWLGTDGLGPVAFTDEAGEAHFQVEDTTQDLSYGYYSVNQKSDIFYSYLNYDLSEQATFRVAESQGGGEETRTITGEVSGLNPSEGGELDIDYGTGDLELALTDSTSLNYSIEVPSTEVIPFIFAAQNDGAFGVGFPSRYQMVLDPQDSESMSLDRTLDAEVVYTPDSLMENPDTISHYLDFSYGGESVSCYGPELPISDERAFIGPITTLDEGLEDVDLTHSIRIFGIDSRYSQGAEISNVSPGEVAISLKDLHTVSVPEGSGVTDFEGLPIAIDNTEGDDFRFVLWEFLEKDGIFGYGANYWRISSAGVPNTLTIPAIPLETGLSWPSKVIEEAGVESAGVWALTTATEWIEAGKVSTSSGFSDWDLLSPSTDAQSAGTLSREAKESMVKGMMESMDFDPESSSVFTRP